MKIKIFILLVLSLFIVPSVMAENRFFHIQAIDTMKYSRDKARENWQTPAFEQEIDTQVRLIAETGATHVAIGTPYEEEFIPFMTVWVQKARKYKLKVWFRGNFAGWEGWFDYPKIDRATHLQKTKLFITQNPDLFEDGDVFVSCPECENGGPGDPRMTGDTNGFRTFIISEYEAVKESFKTIDKEVVANYFSMNGDVARLIMNKETTKKLGGAVTIDHYVKSPVTLVKDTVKYAADSDGDVVLGEFGVPIPDIHGEMTPQAQADWLESFFQAALTNPRIVGLNYWTAKDSSTQLWNQDNTPRLAVNVIKKYYSPHVISGTITDKEGNPVPDVWVRTKYREVVSPDGSYTIPVLYNEKVTFTKNGYKLFQYTPQKEAEQVTDINVELSKQNPFIEKLLNIIKLIFLPSTTLSPVPNN